MADAIVSFVVEKLGEAAASFAMGKLGEYLKDREISMADVRADVVWLKDELAMMRGFLKDAEKKQNDGDERMREWLSSITDLAHEIEDVIDTFFLKVKLEGGGRDNSERRSFKKLRIFHGIGESIKELRNRAIDISMRRKRYGIMDVSAARDQKLIGGVCKFKELRRSSAFADEDVVVGFAEEKRLLAAELNEGDSSRRVISILGMGGSGKTTLARKLYHCGDIVGKFDSSAWVCVSQEYKIRDLLLNIIKSFTCQTKKQMRMLEKMTEEDLRRHLFEFLKFSRYLVVIDDVWDRETWESLRKALPDRRNGSRVIITTRKKAVAECSNARSTFVHEIRPLRPDESWELFSKLAFSNACTAPSSEKMGREMVEKCHGLPLAIAALGELLSRKQNLGEWHQVRDQFWRHLRDDSVHIPAILTLSFYDLPYQLKSCFLYLGVFPEDSIIDAARLRLLWVAEGFIPVSSTSMEETAKEYLNELISRNLVQVKERHWSNTVKCSVYNLLRNLAVEKAEELNFFHMKERTANSGSLASRSSHRRQVAHCPLEKYIKLNNSNSCLRSLLFMDREPSDDALQVKMLEFITRFELLRVLDLQGVKFLRPNSLSKVRLPEAIGNLVHLRYLGLRDAGVQEFPRSIGSLRALQTLDVSCSDNFLFVELPEEMGNLKQLRHLMGDFKGPLPLENLTDLQTLREVDIHDWVKSSTTNLINLRELCLTCLCQGQQVAFDPESTAKLGNLQTLKLDLRDVNSFPSLQPLSHCQHLLQMKVRGDMLMLQTEMHQFLPNLRYLELMATKLEEDPMPVLEKLQSLMILEIHQHGGKEMVSTKTGFPQLEVLKLYECSNLEELRVEEGGMPMLRGFKTSDCSKLLRVSQRLALVPAPRNCHFQSYDGWPF